MKELKEERVKNS